MSTLARAQHLARQMLRAAASDGGKSQLAWLGARKRDQLLHRMRRHRRMHHQVERRGEQHRHGCEVPHRIVRQLLARDGIDHQPRLRAHEEGVSVGRGLCGGLGADRLARAWAVVDHDRLTHALRKFLADRAREAVAQPSGRIRHDEADRTRGIDLLRLNRGRGGQQQQGFEHSGDCMRARLRAA